MKDENRRLEADPTRCFDHREIVVRVEYRYCPNMVMIDTPGLISSRATGGGRVMNSQERALVGLCTLALNPRPVPTVSSRVASTRL